MQVIYNLKNWFKRPEVKMGVVIFFFVFLAFGIGYLIGRDWSPAPIVIEKNNSN